MVGRLSRPRSPQARHTRARRLWRCAKWRVFGRRPRAPPPPCLAPPTLRWCRPTEPAAAAAGADSINEGVRQSFAHPLELLLVRLALRCRRRFDTLADALELRVRRLARHLLRGRLGLPVRRQQFEDRVHATRVTQALACVVALHHPPGVRLGVLRRGEHGLLRRLAVRPRLVVRLGDLIVRGRHRVVRDCRGHSDCVVALGRSAQPRLAFMSIAIHSFKLAFQRAGILKGLLPLGCGYVRSFSHGSSSTSGDAGCGCTTPTRRASFRYGSPRADAVGHAHAHRSLKCTPAFALRLCAGLCHVAIGRVCDTAVSSSPLFSPRFRRRLGRAASEAPAPAPVCPHQLCRLG
mmetsp:Transcript_20659/g.64096  ORF Transcript_20659/g.64096 Transcript_20659/m.64096 type:complete len:349 (-) Transcript_20659:357-1403(-)